MFFKRNDLLSQVKKYVKDNYVEIKRECCKAKKIENIDYTFEDKLCLSLSSIDEISIKAEESWQQSLFRWIDEKGYKDSEVYKRSNISKQTFSKIRSNDEYQPNKDTAIQLCFGLKLGIDDTLDLIGKAGFYLSDSIKRDLVVRYFIEKGIYEMDTLNIILDEMKLKLFPIN